MIRIKLFKNQTNQNDDFPLKNVELRNMTNKFFQINLCIKYKCQNITELKCLKELHANKTDGVSGCIICHYRYFFNINLKLQLEVCHGCHNLMEKAMIFNDVAFVTAKGNYYRIHFLYMSKDKAIDLLRNADLTKTADNHKTRKFIVTYENG